MKRIITLLAIAAIIMPTAAWAKKTVTEDEYGEEYELNPEALEQVAPMPSTADDVTIRAKEKKAPAITAIEEPMKEEPVKAKGKKSSAIEEVDVGLPVEAPAEKIAKKETKKATAKETKKETKKVTEPAEETLAPDDETYPPPAHLSKPTPTAYGREGAFRVGLVGPGIGVANEDVGALMTVGLEGEYFIFEKLSVAFRIETLTKFKDPTIVSFYPMARYTFDFDRFTRWAIYVGAGAGVAVYNQNGGHVAADIVLPNGGFWWQWTDNWSVGLDSAVHIYARDNTVVGITFAPALRYMF